MKEYLFETRGFSVDDLFSGDIIIAVHVDGNHWVFALITRVHVPGPLTDFSRFDCPAFRSFMSHTLAKAVRSLTESIAKKYPPCCVIPRVFLALPTVCQPPFNTAPARQTTGRRAASCPLVISDSD